MGRSGAVIISAAVGAGCLQTMAWLGGSLAAGGLPATSQRSTVVTRYAVITGGGAEGAQILEDARILAGRDSARAEFRRMDVNSDGFVDKSEFAGADFDKVDSDGDGVLTEAEWKVRAAFLDILERKIENFKKADANADGFVDLAEAEAAGIDKKAFAKLDKNKDGKLDDGEYQPPVQEVSGGKSSKDEKALNRLRLAAAENPIGPLTPLVRFATAVVGEEKLFELRKMGIQSHTLVIKETIDSWKDSPVGQTLFKMLFEASDTDESGDVDEEELYQMIQQLGFTWLKRKDCSNILQRADADGTGTIDFGEFPDATMPTLRKNLAKLASANGKKLGLLS